MKNKIKEKAHYGYICTGNGDSEICYLCECIEKAIDLTRKQALEEVEEVIDKNCHCKNKEFFKSKIKEMEK